MPMTAPFPLPHVPVDFNVRSANGWVRTRLMKASSPQDLEVGSAMWVIERDEGLRGLAIVAEIDHERGLLYLDIEWDSVSAASDRGETSNTSWELLRLSAGRREGKLTSPSTPQWGVSRTRSPVPFVQTSS